MQRPRQGRNQPDRNSTYSNFRNPTCYCQRMFQHASYRHLQQSDEPRNDQRHDLYLDGAWRGRCERSSHLRCVKRCRDPYINGHARTRHRVYGHDHDRSHGHVRQRSGCQFCMELHDQSQSLSDSGSTQRGDPSQRVLRSMSRHGNRCHLSAGDGSFDPQRGNFYGKPRHNWNDYARCN
jgi:hypothetical protein